MDETNPISIHGDGLTLAKQAVQGEGGHWPIPEGTILAPLWKRLAAFVLDTLPVMGVLFVLTKGWVVMAWNLSMLLTPQWWFVFLNWGLLLGAFYLYHKVLVTWMGRSLGQYWFGLAVVREDGGRLPRVDCGRRAVAKLRYLVPLVNLWCFFVDARLIVRRHTHQSSIDLACASIVVIANSLPPAKRRHLR